jgi:hypothetical protein
VPAACWLAGAERALTATTTPAVARTATSTVRRSRRARWGLHGVITAG